jgi:hypothetical protein
VLHDHLLELRVQFFAAETQNTVEKRFWVYLNHWLSSLWVVAHAFRHVLKLSDRVPNDLIDENLKALSDFRNGTYHYHRQPEKHVQFFRANALDWAEDLYAEFERYFRDYLLGLESFFPESFDRE